MELFKIHSLLMVLILLSGSWGRSSNKGEGEKGCPSRSEFSKMMLRKLEDVEKDILNAFRSVTEEIGDCEDADSCPENSWRRGSSCYYIGDGPATWGEAMETCIKDFGGYLAVVDDEEENKFLQNIARPKGSGAELWMGGTDAFKEGEWRWINTMKPFSSSRFSDWTSMQPDNGSGNEHCLEMKGGYGFHWNDDQCFHRQKFICEKDLN